MASWIFQGNPNTFDIDGYLANNAGEIRWLVTRHASTIAADDEVFLWRSASQTNPQAKSGVIAKASVVESPRAMPADAESVPFFKSTPPDSTAVRVRLRLLSVARTRREVIQRDWLKEDSALQGMLIMRQASGTNFPLTESEASRLNRLWANTGRDWTADESRAALLLYEQLQGQAISRTAGSPVERLAQTIGRAPTGVYNKLMNFRALDPRAPQTGLDGGSKTDRAVWQQYFDGSTQTLRLDDLAADVQRAIPTEVVNREAIDVEQEARRLETLPYEALLQRYQEGRSKSLRPKKVQGTSTAFVRNPQVVALTRLRAQHRCEVPGCSSSVFRGEDGLPYVEVHHLEMLADGGDDDISNTVAVCPNHHRELHFGANRLSLRESLEKLRR